MEGSDSLAGLMASVAATVRTTPLKAFDAAGAWRQTHPMQPGAAMTLPTEAALPAQPTLPIRLIVQGKNPREYFDPDEMAELEEGIRAAGGVLQPILVRPITGCDLHEIIAGERRWRAAKNVLGDDYDIPVVFRQASDEAAEAMAVIENHHRADMSHAEEARAAQRQLLRNRGDRDETARAMGWSPDLLDRRLALLACTTAVLKALTERRIQLGHAELLSGIPPTSRTACWPVSSRRRCRWPCSSRSWAAMHGGSPTRSSILRRAAAARTTRRGRPACSPSPSAKATASTRATSRN
jgi:ParB/RepB/Spo0J family partition protein